MVGNSFYSLWFCIKLLMLGRSPVDGLVRLDRLGYALFIHYVFCIKLLMLGRSPGGPHRQDRVAPQPGKTGLLKLKLFSISSKE